MLNLKRFALWLFSCGWLAPLILSAFLFVDWAERIVMPSIRAGASNEGQHSFLPYALAEQSLAVTIVWLALVVVYWASRAVYGGRAR